MTTTRIAIIGTAGQKTTLSKTLYEKMAMKALDIIHSIQPDSNKVHLISGGAAWSDHVAVNLYLNNKFAGLTLHLPCKVDELLEKSSPSHYAKTTIDLHTKFSKAIKQDTIAQIKDAVQNKGAVVTSSNGFYPRNLLVGRHVDVVIAFSWGRGDR